MSHPPGVLTQTVVLLFASAGIAYVCHRLRVLPIVGFLLAGVAIGPNALGLIESASVIELAGELGVVLLLFTLGIEFSLERLARIKRAIFGGGGLQVLLTIAAVAAVLMLFGIDWRTGVFTGSLVALSSTAIVLKILGDAHDTTSGKAQLALGMLIFQDFAIIVLAMIVPMLGDAAGGGSAVAVVRAVGTAIVIIIVVVIAARRLMPIVLERVARTCSQEIFLLTIIAICLGTAWLTSLAGVSLSLGAFLAGLVVSDSRFRHHAFAEILPLQILFSAVFFVSVGLLLDIGFVLERPLLVLGVAAGVIVLKVVVATGAALILRYPVRTAAGTAILLAQIGEFSFVLERIGRASGLHPGGVAGAGGQTFIAVAVLLMVGTPLLAKLSRALESKMDEDETAAVAETPLESEVAEDLANHVIVGGYGTAARYLTRVLRDSGIPFIIVTLSPTGASEAERDGLPVILGDYSRAMLLNHVGIDRAKMLVVPDDAADMAHRVTAVARGLNPTLRIVVRTYKNAEVEPLLREGADDVLVDELEIGIELFTRVLADYRVDEDEINDHVATVRAGGYAALLRAISDEPLVVCGSLDDACFDTRTFTVREGAAAAQMTGRAFAEAAQITIISIARDGEPLEHDAGLQPGDRVTARASAEAFRSAAGLLRGDANVRSGDAPEPRVITLSAVQRNTELCTHAASVEPEITTTATGCEECVKTGDRWVHLRICMTCGTVRCCDSSPNRHATKHTHESRHPIIRSYQPGETWAWCYVDEVTF